MLNSCGLALSQGDGSDFHPRCNWETTNSPWLQSPCKSLERIGSTPQGHTCPNLLWQPSKAGRIGNAGSCGQLWEELEMVQQREIGTGI